ncbi:hypothetical protein AB833_00110 [Chromatiales bacterium (ex Bugula neritina AB1)]|nr:hypothetical protein AB833_00110 [Chromatiales bacterium (ex Bugula neritina AB1)]
MAELTAGKKAKQKKSRFQKLWEKADRLQRKNSKLRDQLEQLIQRADDKIRPVERAGAIASVPLFEKLLQLGQRKSLAKWERQILDDWIRDLITGLQPFGLVDDDLQDQLARYDAFRLGVELCDDDASGRPYQQLSEYMEKLQAESEQSARDQKDEAEQVLRDLQGTIDEEIEGILDEQLGPPPVPPEKHSLTMDLLQDELDAEWDKKIKAYHAERELLREQLKSLFSGVVEDELGASPLDSNFVESLLEDHFGENDFDEDNIDEEFGNFEHPADPEAPQIDSAMFQRMFRTTAAKLHPDREPDADKRNAKQHLMVELLNARKKGDVLTILRMYQQHAATTEPLSKADESQLINALTHQIDQLEEEEDDIINQSELHWLAYNKFYHSSRKKQDKAIDEHIQMAREEILLTEDLVDSITSLKTLKPHLQRRNVQSNPFAEMEEFLDSLRPW